MRFGLALLGLVIGGPIGAIIGYFLGVFIEKSQIDIRRQAEQSTQDAFFLALSGLAAEVIKIDGVVSKAEVLFAKEFFIREFGPATADRMMKRLKIFVSEKVPVEQICRQISEIFDPSARLWRKKISLNGLPSFLAFRQRKTVLPAECTATT